MKMNTSAAEALPQNCPVDSFSASVLNETLITCIPCKSLCNGENKNGQLCGTVCPEFRVSIDFDVTIVSLLVILAVALILHILLNAICYKTKVSSSKATYVDAATECDIKLTVYPSSSASYGVSKEVSTQPTSTNFGTINFYEYGQRKMPSSVSQQSFLEFTPIPTLERVHRQINRRIPHESSFSENTSITLPDVSSNSFKRSLQSNLQQEKASKALYILPSCDTRQECTVLPSYQESESEMSYIPRSYAPTLPLDHTDTEIAEKSPSTSVRLNDSATAYESIRRNTIGHVPSSVFGVQFCKSIDTVFVYADRTREQNARAFVDKYLSQYSDLVAIRVIPSEPPELLDCEMCNKPLCPSLEGHSFNGHQKSDYIHPGSRIFAVDTVLWHDISSDINKVIFNFDDLKNVCDKLVGENPTKYVTVHYKTNSEKKETNTNLTNVGDYTLPSWSLGFSYELDLPEGKESVFVSTAHSLAKYRQYDSHSFRNVGRQSLRNDRYVFITEMTMNKSPRLQVISTEHWGIFKETETCCMDILLMFPSNEALNLYKPMVPSCCDNQKLTPREFNIEERDHISLVGDHVTKYGYFSGATYGEIINLDILINRRSELVQQNVFGVISTMKSRSRFADHGDSGSVVMKKDAGYESSAIGLVWCTWKTLFFEKSGNFEEIVLCVTLKSCLNHVVSEMLESKRETDSGLYFPRSGNNAMKTSKTFKRQKEIEEKKSLRTVETEIVLEKQLVYNNKGAGTQGNGFRKKPFDCRPKTRVNPFDPEQLSKTNNSRDVIKHRDKYTSKTYYDNSLYSHKSDVDSGTGTFVNVDQEKCFEHYSKYKAATKCTEKRTKADKWSHSHLSENDSGTGTYVSVMQEDSFGSELHEFRPTPTRMPIGSTFDNAKQERPVQFRESSWFSDQGCVGKCKGEMSPASNSTAKHRSLEAFTQIIKDNDLQENLQRLTLDAVSAAGHGRHFKDRNARLKFNPFHGRDSNFYEENYENSFIHFKLLDIPWVERFHDDGHTITVHANLCNANPMELLDELCKKTKQPRHKFIVKNAKYM